MPTQKIQPMCTRMHRSCGGQFDEGCCSGLSCVVDDRYPTFASLEGNSNTISRSIRMICSPTQKKKRERKGLGSIVAGNRVNRSGLIM